MTMVVQDNMESKLKASIDRAIALLGTEPNYEAYTCLKITPEGGGCCCFHCWPHTWGTVNREIQPFGPLKDEGDVLIETGDGKFVLECHESGPEIVVIMTTATVGFLLIKSIIELVTTILKSKSKDIRRKTNKLIITKRTFTGPHYREDRIIEVDLPADKTSLVNLAAELRKALVKTTKPKTLKRNSAKSHRTL